MNAKYCCLAAHMLVLNILLNVLRLIFNVSYSLEAGLLNLIFLYRSSLNRIDRSNPVVIHFEFYVFVFVVFHKCTCHVSVFVFFNDIMSYIIASIRVCCQPFIYFIVQFGRTLSLFILSMTFSSSTYFLRNLGLLQPENVMSSIIK